MSSEFGSFQFPFYLNEYADRLKAKLPEEYRNLMNELSTVFQLRDDDLEDFLADSNTPDALSISRSTLLAIVTGTPTAVTMTTEDLSIGGGATWAAGDPTKISFTESGIWTIHAWVVYSASATGERELLIRHNGSTTLHRVTANTTPAVPTGLSCVGIFQVASGDYVELVTQHNAGANRNITPARLQVVREGASS